MNLWTHDARCKDGQDPFLIKIDKPEAKSQSKVQGPKSLKVNPKREKGILASGLSLKCHGLPPQPTHPPYKGLSGSMNGSNTVPEYPCVSGRCPRLFLLDSKIRGRTWGGSPSSSRTLSKQLLKSMRSVGIP